MTYDPKQAAIIRLRLEIGRTLDESADVSFLQRAQLRLTLLSIQDQFDHKSLDTTDTLTALHALAEEVGQLTTKV